MHDYIDCDATELAHRLQTRQISAPELVETAIAAIEEVNPKLNAVVHPMYAAARKAAAGPLPEGPFQGVPMVVKDFDGFVAGEPFTASTRFLEGFVPDHDSEAIARLRRAGLIFVAKSNLPELAILGTTESEWRGAAHNPWNLKHSTGGSSGGSAALVASRAIPIGHGGDGGGSLRIPASACGLVGLKASRGRIPLGPDQAEGWGGYVQWGVLTRSVRDTAALLDVLSGPMPGDSYAAPPPERPFKEEVGRALGRLRIAFSTQSIFGKQTDPECVRAVQVTAKLLEELGHTVEEAMPDYNRDRLVRAYLAQVAVGTAAEIDDMAGWVKRKPSPAYFEASTWFLNQVGHTLSGLELQHARDAIQEAGRAMGRFHQRYDLLLLPTLAHPPVELGTLGLKPAERIGLAALRLLPVGAAIRIVLDQLAANNFERTPNTQLFNQTGQPAISLPMYWSASGLPIGIQLSAAFGREGLLLNIASQLEVARPWMHHRPAVCATGRP